MNFLEHDFLLRLSPQLSLFKKKGHLYNFRCPICGDSQLNKSKARGYIFEKKGTTFFHCHNCAKTLKFDKFLKAVNPSLHGDYMLELFKEKRKPDIDEELLLKSYKPVSFEKRIPLPSVESLSRDHLAKKYLISRKLPHEYFNKLYYCENFAEFVDKFIPNHEKQLPKDERIIIPFEDEKGNLIGFQGSALNPREKLRYITMKAGEENIKAYGLDRINFGQIINVVEGPFDSMLIHNCLAVTDSNLTRVIPIIGSYNYRFIFDNQPRNPDIVRLTKNAIEAGHDVFIWPSFIEQKDINDVIKDSNYTSADMNLIIEKYTFNGITAKLKFNQWSKL